MPLILCIPHVTLPCTASHGANNKTLLMPLECQHEKLLLAFVTISLRVERKHPVLHQLVSPGISFLNPLKLVLSDSGSGRKRQRKGTQAALVRVLCLKVLIYMTEVLAVLNSGGQVETEQAVMTQYYGRISPPVRNVI